jgi:type IV secretion system protein VirB2
MPWLVLGMLAMLLPELAIAAGNTLPYEDGLKTLYKSLTGPVPFAISLVGIVACGAMLIFGGEISGFMRTLVFIVLVVAVIVQAASVVELLGGDWDGLDAGTVASAPLDLARAQRTV